MKRILDVISDAVNQADVRCLPCERVNLDYPRFNEYLDSDEHKASDIFEHPPPKPGTIYIPPVPENIPSILRYFIDGSRRTYKIADLLIGGRYLPLIAGQAGIGVIHRNANEKLKPYRDL